MECVYHQGQIQKVQRGKGWGGEDVQGAKCIKVRGTKGAEPSVEGVWNGRGFPSPTD